ncbi:MAG: nuclear transport factor 2 family protein [Acidimicrobiia bacterium]|nr:nuclear transport factor 2 family protein [Acidimicrobiia bacterium]
MTDAPDIHALEDRRWAAQIGADIDELSTLLADELSYTHSNGLVDTKASYLAAIEKKVFDYRDEKRTDTAVTIIGDTAMVTGRIAMHVVAGERDVNLDSRYSAVWVLRSGSWQFLCWQSTPLP